jgi:hypothetical protein
MAERGGQGIQAEMAKGNGKEVKPENRIFTNHFLSEGLGGYIAPRLELARPDFFSFRLSPSSYFPCPFPFKTFCYSYEKSESRFVSPRSRIVNFHYLSALTLPFPCAWGVSFCFLTWVTPSPGFSSVSPFQQAEHFFMFGEISSQLGQSHFITCFLIIGERALNIFYDSS